MTKQEYQQLINDEETLIEIKERIESTAYKGSQSYAYYGVETGKVGEANRDNWVQKEIIAFGGTKANIPSIKQTIKEHYYETCI